MLNGTQKMLLMGLISCSYTVAQHIPQTFSITFDESMTKNCSCYAPSHIKKSLFWKLAKKSYDDFILNNQDYSESPRIPKIIHQIWVGPHPFPEASKKLAQTWRHFNPDWEYKLWTNEDIAKFGLINQKAYNATSNYGEKSDIARYEILNRYGGLYVDTDFECLQSFDFFNHCCNFYAGVGFGECEEVYIGLIGSTPDNPILKEAIQNIRISNGSHDSNVIFNRTGPYFFGRCVEKVLSQHNDHYVLFPVTYFYPWPHHHRHEKTRSQIEKWFRPESFAVHHWHVSWNK